MLDTSTFVYHHMVHFLIILHSGYLGTTSMSDDTIPKNHRTLTCHIDDGVQAMTTAYMVQDWLREVNQNLGRASRRGVIKRILYNIYRSLWNKAIQFMDWFCNVVDMDTKSWNWMKVQVKFVVYVVTLVRDSNHEIEFALLWIHSCQRSNNRTQLGRPMYSYKESTKTCASNNHSYIKKALDLQSNICRCFIVNLLTQHKCRYVNLVARSRRTCKNEPNNTHIPLVFN